MSSFKRRTAIPSQPAPKATKHSPALSSLLLTSTGIPSLDDVLGGGIQLGTTLTVLNPDPHSAHLDLLQKYFIAQGILSGHSVQVFDVDASDLVDSCMWCPGSAATSSVLTDDEGAGEDEKVKIAWRYESMRKFKTTVSSARDEEEEYCRPFDLTQSIPKGLTESLIETGQLHLEVDKFQGETVLDSVIQRLHNFLTSRSENTCTRIALPAFGSAPWGDMEPKDILSFMLRLRALLRKHPLSCAFVTLPADVSSESWGGDGWIEKLSWVSDACLTLASASADPSASSVYPSHHGLLKILRLPTVQTLVPASDRFSTLRGLATSSSSSASASGGIGENNLAFKVTRKRFVIETFHLDVEGGVGERRTTPAPSAVSEGGTHQHSDKEERPQAGIEVQLQPDHPPAGKSSSAIVISEAPLTPESGGEKKGILKKPKKRVGFQVARPDVLDF